MDIVSRIKSTVDGKAILDVGCGDGHFLNICKSTGFDCHGVESSKALSSYARLKVGDGIINSPYEKALFPAETFDIITIIQVFEHIEKPIDLLGIANHHLKPDGIVVIEVPSINAPNFLAYRATKIRSFVKPPTGVIPSHFGYFSPATLSFAAQKAGFRRISLVTGRWKYKYSGAKKVIGALLDPLLDLLRIGGILYIGRKG
jgi:ubiquinone/menaquinone biosynthesis C-methylase UbiE